MFKCNFCPLKYANKSNRSRHERDKNFVEKRLIVYRCNECSFTAQMFSILQILLSMKLLLAGTCPRKTFTKQSHRNLIKFESAPVKIDLQWRLLSNCFNIQKSFSFIFKRCDNCF